MELCYGNIIPKNKKTYNKRNKEITMNGTCAWREQNKLIKMVMEQNSYGIRHSSKSRIKREHVK